MAHKFKVGSYWKYADVIEAAELIQSGQPVGIFNRGACTIWGNPHSAAFLGSLSEIKGQPLSEIPLTGAALAEHLVGLVSAGQIAKRLRGVFTDARVLVHRFGSLVTLQLPVKQTAVQGLPGTLVPEIAGEGLWLGNWEPSGHHPAHQLVSELAGLGMPLPVFTPMDAHDKAQINDQYEGILFSEKNRIPLFLEDYHDTNRVRGLHTVLRVNREGVHLLQEGGVPGELFDLLVGEAVDRSGSLEARPAQKPFPIHIPENTNPQAVRLAILCYLQGWSADQLSHLLLATEAR